MSKSNSGNTTTIMVANLLPDDVFIFDGKEYSYKANNPHLVKITEERWVNVMRFVSNDNGLEKVCTLFTTDKIQIRSRLTKFQKFLAKWFNLF